MIIVRAVSASGRVCLAMSEVLRHPVNLYISVTDGAYMVQRSYSSNLHI